MVACGILLEAHRTPSPRDGDFSSFVSWDVKSSFGALVRIPCPESRAGTGAGGEGSREETGVVVQDGLVLTWPGRYGGVSSKDNS